ncbi:MAG: TonB-dependent receptor [Opitutales bacterium]|nr:TonB-dependent receptor [Opitutales bacterium]
MIKFLGFSLLAGNSLFGNAELEPMVVVETRSPQPLSEASPWVTRISGNDLEQRQIYNLSDALRSVPGMAVVRSGQTGSQTSLFSRGGESNHVTFLYEGRKLNGGFSRTYNLGELPLLNSSSVEVLRGASSSLHGANAMGGTVYMRSLLPSENGHESQAGLSVGSFDTLSSNYNTSFKEGSLSGNFGFSTLETKNDRLNSDFDNLSASFLVEQQVSDKLYLNLLGIGYTSEFGTVGTTYSEDYDNFQETEQYLISPQIKYSDDDLRASLTYSISKDDLLGQRDVSDKTQSLTDEQSVNLIIENQLTDNFFFTISTEYSRTEFAQDGLSPYASPWSEGNSWEQKSASVGFNAQLSENNEVGGNVRYDDYSDFDNPLTYDLRINTSVNESITTFLKHSTGYAPPTALDLYGIGPWYPGNPNLEAEESKNYEVGFSYNTKDNNYWSLTYFYTDYENLIDSTPQNINKTSTSGFEISSKNYLNDYFRINSSITMMSSKNKDSGDEFLDRRPELFGSISLTYEKEALMIGSELISKYKTKEKNWANFGEFVDADDYTVARLFSSYQFENGLGISARIENLFDKEYSEVHGYPALGRAFHAGLNYSF